MNDNVQIVNVLQVLGPDHWYIKAEVGKQQLVGQQNCPRKIFPMNIVCD